MNLNFANASITNKGGRDVNEDSVAIYKNDNDCCYILCDGLGGHGMGDVASSLVIETFKKEFEKRESVVSFFDAAFLKSQDVLLAEQNKRNTRKKMKTTVAALATDGKNAYIGHAGDSRVYVFDKNGIKYRTKDHSVVQALVALGEIKESEIRNHPDRNMLLRALGDDFETPKHELAPPVSLKKIQAFLLCSDGFWELIEEKEMSKLLKESVTVEEWLQKMTAVVRKNGENLDMDNYSAIAVRREQKRG